MRTRAALGIALTAVFAAGCAPEFDRVSEIEGLRVLAVQKDKPYARPGETVNLSILWRDAPDKAGRPVQVQWIYGCVNPPGDLFYSCFAPSNLSQLRFAEPQTCPPQPGQQCTNRLSLEIPPDIVSSRPATSDPTQPAYGLAYVIFAVCGGRLLPVQPASERDFPFGCFDENGTRLGPDDFVAGYASIYAYDAFTNANPPLLDFYFDDAEAPTRCVDAECLGPPAWNNLRCMDGHPNEPVGDRGLNVPLKVPCVPSCEDDGEDTCRPHKIRPKLDLPEAGLAGYPNPDEISNLTRNRNITEQMWINYYVERGGVKSEVRLLNDAFAGVNEDFGTEFYAPRAPGVTVIWAVVHDNRGGMSWVGMPLIVQSPDGASP